MTKIIETDAPNPPSNTQAIRNEGDRQKSIPARKRHAFGTAQSKLAVENTDPNFHYHWINDVPGRIDEAMAGGYEFVKREEVSLLPGVTPRNSAPGDQVSAIVGKNEDGTALRAYLMKIPLEWYEENQKIIQDRVNLTDAAIREGRVTADTNSSKFYHKSGDIKMQNKLGE